MEGHIQNLLLILFEVVCCEIFYETFGKKRYGVRIFLLQIVMLWGACFVTAYIFAFNFSLRQIICILVYGIFMFWCIDISVQKSIVLAVFYMGILGVVDYLAYTINNFIFLI